MKTFSDVADSFVALITTYIIPFFSTLIFFIFLVGVVKYIGGGANEAKRKEGIRFITISIIVLFVMFTIFALVGIITSTFGIGVKVPQINL